MYRVVSKQFNNEGVEFDNNGLLYGLFEVHFEGDNTEKPHSRLAEPVTGWYPSVKHLQDDLETMLEQSKKREPLPDFVDKNVVLENETVIKDMKSITDKEADEIAADDMASEGEIEHRDSR